MTYSLDLPTDVIAGMRNLARDADISAARTFGFGGPDWDASVPSGQGTGARTLTPAGTIHGLAFRQKPGVQEGVAGGTPVLDDVWRMIVLDGELRPGMVLTSQADSRYQFSIGTIEPWYEYFKCELERRR
jgi:hypothetical protein